MKDSNTNNSSRRTARSGRTWAGSIRKSQSDGTGTIFRQGNNNNNNGSSSSKGCSPPDEMIPENCVANPRIPISSSPQTPPKKNWERHYRSFLQRGEKPQPPVGLPLALPSAQNFLINGSNEMKRTGSESGGEGSVRGGSFFANVFHRSKDSSGSVSSTAAASMPTSELDTPPPNRRKHHSFGNADELDGTMRRGTEKAYSPGNQRLRHITAVHEAQGNVPLPAMMAPPVLIKRGVSEGHAAATHHVTGSSGQPPAALRPRIRSEGAFTINSALMQQSGPATSAVAAEELLSSTPTTAALSSLASNDHQGSSSSIAMSEDDARDMDLSRSSSAMKKAFTEFHNSAHTGRDSSHAYLGDDPSNKGNNLVWAPNQQLAAQAKPVSLQPASSSLKGTARLGGSASHNNLRGHFNKSPSTLETVQESVAIKCKRILKPILGVDTWNNGRRYLIAPAALLACPMSVLTTLSGSSENFTAGDAAHRESRFGTIVLGEALLTYMGASQKSQTVQQWSSACLVLRQNYLLEYDNAESMRGLPRGFCHLQYAICHDHPDFSDALELHFYASPCAKSDKRILMIRLKRREDRENWKQCLNRAAGLQVSDLYEFDKHIPLGKGQYASVHPARRKDSTSLANVVDADVKPGYDCALKIFDKKEFWKLVVKGRERADTLVRETAVQATLTANCGKVASFLRIRGFFETSDNVVLELELLEGTDLFQFISSKRVLAENEAGRIISDILKSLQTMNRIGLAHRDIKPANILICHAGPQGPAVKVGDFGMSTFVGVDGQVRGKCGTPGYVAPEIFTAGVYGGYGDKVDVFSAGVTLYVMLCGVEPFFGESDAELVNANKAAILEFTEEVWTDISNEAQDLITKMMHPNPARRLNAKEALQHPWLRQLNGESDALDISQTQPTSETPSEDACVIS